MKLIFFAPNAIGGVNIYLRNLVFELKNKGIDCLIVYYGYEKSELHAFAFEKILKLNKYDNRRTVLNKLKSHIKSSQDIIIANDSLELEMCNFFKLTNKLIFIMHGENTHYEETAKHFLIDRIFAVSSCLAIKFGINQEQVINPIVQNGKLTKKKLSESIKIAYIGRLELDKGAQEIIKLDNHMDIEWGFFVPKNASDMAFINNIKSKKVFLNIENSKLLEELKNYNFLFFPSKSEGFGISILEAMKNSVVPIVRNVQTGLIFQLRHNVNCIKYDNIETLTLDIRYLFANQDNYNFLLENAYSYSTVHFNKDQIIDKFISQVKKIELKKSKPFQTIAWPIQEYLPNSIFRELKKIYHGIIKCSNHGI